MHMAETNVHKKCFGVMCSYVGLIDKDADAQILIMTNGM